MDKLRISINHAEKRLNSLTLKTVAVLFFAIYLVSIYPILRANITFVDDLRRAYEGTDGWENFSRYITNFLSHIIHAGSYLADISPIPQILAVVALIVASLIVIVQIKQIKGAQEGCVFSIWDVAALVPLGLCPYFLGCLVYKYDSPYMALSVLISVLPLIFRKKNIFIYSGSVIACMLVMCMTYQASSGIFPMVVVLSAFLMWCKNYEIKEIVKFVVSSASSYIIGIGIYFLFIMEPVDTYVSNSIASVSEILSHYRSYYNFFRTDFRKGWILIILLLTAFFVVANVAKSRRNKFVTAILALLAVVLMALLTVGLYPYLAETLYDCRAMYGVGAYIAFISIGNLTEGKWQWPLRALTIVLSYSFIVFACTFGNAMAAQDEYVDFRIEEVIEDLSDLDEFNTDTEKTICFVGSVGYCPVIENMPDNFHLIERLVPVTFRSGWKYGQYKFFYYYGLENVTGITNDEVDFEYEDWELLHESSYHSIYYEDGVFVIELK